MKEGDDAGRDTDVGSGEWGVIEIWELEGGGGEALGLGLGFRGDVNVM